MRFGQVNGTRRPQPVRRPHQQASWWRRCDPITILTVISVLAVGAVGWSTFSVPASKAPSTAALEAATSEAASTTQPFLVREQPLPLPQQPQQQQQVAADRVKPPTSKVDAADEQGQPQQSATQAGAEPAAAAPKQPAPQVPQEQQQGGSLFKSAAQLAIERLRLEQRHQRVPDELRSPLERPPPSELQQQGSAAQVVEIAGVAGGVGVSGTAGSVTPQQQQQDDDDGEQAPGGPPPQSAAAAHAAAAAGRAPDFVNAHMWSNVDAPLLNHPDAKPSVRPPGATPRHNVIGSGDSRGLVLTYYTPGPRFMGLRRTCNWEDMLIENRRAYAQAHGLAYEVDNTPMGGLPIRGSSWGRIQALLRACSTRAHPWVLMLDADVLLTSLDKTVTGSVADGRFDIVAARGHNGQPSTGAMLVKCSAWSKAFFHRVWSNVFWVGHEGEDEGAFAFMLQQHPADAAHVKQGTRRTVQSMPYGYGDSSDEWREGDLTLHLSGVRAEDMQGVLDNYASALAGLGGVASKCVATPGKGGLRGPGA